MKSQFKLTLATALIALFGFSVAGCEQDGPMEDNMEDVGQTMDNSMEEAGETMDQAGAATRDTIQDGANAIEDKADETADGMNY